MEVLRGYHCAYDPDPALFTRTCRPGARAAIPHIPMRGLNRSMSNDRQQLLYMSPSTSHPRRPRYWIVE